MEAVHLTTSYSEQGFVPNFQMFDCLCVRENVAHHENSANLGA